MELILIHDKLPLCEGHLFFTDMISYLPNSVAFRRGGRNANYISRTYVTTIHTILRPKLHQRFVKKMNIFVLLLIKLSIITTTCRKLV